MEEQINIDSAIAAIKNLGVSLNDYDSACLDFVVSFCEDSNGLLKQWINDCITVDQVKDLERKSMHLISYSVQAKP